jgi:hypothetical protein
MEQVWSTAWNKGDRKLFVHILNSKHMNITIGEIVEKKRLRERKLGRDDKVHLHTHTHTHTQR